MGNGAGKEAQEMRRYAAVFVACLLMISMLMGCTADAPPLETEKPAGKPNLSRFLAGIDQSLANFRQSGVSAVSERRETDQQIVVTITIPKSQ